MQARRPVIWVVLPLVLLATCAVSHAPWSLVGPPALVAGTWAFSLQVLGPAAFGCLLADRIGRERRLRVEEILGSLPAAPGRLLLGKYLGAALATALPLLAVYVAGTLYLAVVHGPGVLAQAAAALVLIVLPGLCFVAAFAIGCPAVMPVALFQFLFVGYWFWGNFLPLGFHIPTIAGTILTPLGGYAASAFFGTNFFLVHPPVQPLSAIASIGLLLAVAACALWATHVVTAVQRARRMGGRPGRAVAARGAPRPASGAQAGWGQGLRLELRIVGPGVVLTPLLIVAVFAFLALLTVIVGGGRMAPRILTAALECGLCLGAGIAAANLVATEPAVELHLALPRGYRVTALTRLAIAVACAGLLGLVMSAVLGATGLWLTGEPFWATPLVWAVPILWMSAAGAALSAALRSRAGSVGILTGLWLALFIARGLFRARAWLRPFDLFATSFARGAPWWLANRLELTAMAVVLAAVAWILLGNGEALVGSAQE